MFQKFMHPTLFTQLALVFMFVILSGCQTLFEESEEEKLARLQGAVVQHYADMALAVYQDSHLMAEKLRHAVTMLVLSPSEQNLKYAREAWLGARVPYQQSEVFGVGNSALDGWRKQVNAWPLDEGLIDYVTPAYEHAKGNAGAKANIVANRIVRVGSQALNAVNITPKLIAALNQVGGSEANVASGFHAIEFLLWGQDLNVGNTGSGDRSYTDFEKASLCTNENCQRRGQYLIAASQLLVDDLAYMVSQWQLDGASRAALLEENSSTALSSILIEMKILSMDKLARERFQGPLNSKSGEHEQDDFSDNTHYSHFYTAKGIQNIYLGRYKRHNGPLLVGPSLSRLVSDVSPELDQKILTALEDTQNTLQEMVSLAEDLDAPMRFDMMISAGNSEGARIITDAVSKLTAQTALFDEMESVLMLP